MIESTDNGVDFEMEELRIMELERIKTKCLAKNSGGWKYYDTTILNENERKIYFSSLKKGGFDGQEILKKGKQYHKDYVQRKEEYRYLMSGF